MTLSEKNNRLKKSAAFFSVLLSVFLIIFKFIAFIKTDSLAIFSSFIDSITDLFASAISFVAIYFSSKPASYTHRFGYGKSEALSALLQAILVGFSGCFVIFDGIRRLIHPVEIMQVDVGIIVMTVSILLTFILVLYQTIVANKTGSLAIKADRTHYTVDFLTNSAVIVSLIFVYFFDFYYFDVIAALFISIYLLHNAYSLSLEAFDQLTDKELSSEIRDNIEVIVKNSKGIHGMHDFRSRSLGDLYYFELHLEIDGSLSLFKAHEYAKAVEQKILELYPNSQVLIHHDPYGIHEDRLDHHIDGTCQL